MFANSPNSTFTNRSRCGGKKFCGLNELWSVLTLYMTLFYIVLLIALILYKRKLQSSFYTIVISLGLANVIYSLFQYTFIRKLPIGIVNENILNSHEFAIAIKALNKAIYYVEVCGVVLLAFNRHWALTKSLPRFRRHWNKVNTCKYITIQWLVGMMWIPSMLLPGNTCHYGEQYGEPVFDDPQVEKFYYLIDMPIETTMLLLLIFLYSNMFVKLRYYNRRVSTISIHSRSPSVISKSGNITISQVQSIHLQTLDQPSRKISTMSTTQSQDPSSKKGEVWLAIIGLITTVLFGVMWFFWCLFSLGYGSNTLRILAYLAQDIFMFSNPFLLIIFSAKVREAIGNCFFCGGKLDKLLEDTRSRFV